MAERLIFEFKIPALPPLGEWFHSTTPTTGGVDHNYNYEFVPPGTEADASTVLAVGSIPAGLPLNGAMTIAFLSVSLQRLLGDPTNTRVALYVAIIPAFERGGITQVVVDGVTYLKPANEGFLQADYWFLLDNGYSVDISGRKDWAAWGGSHFAIYADAEDGGEVDPPETSTFWTALKGCTETQIP